MPVGVLVDPKAEVEQEYYAGVLWDGRAKRPMMLFSDMGGIDIEQVAEEHPDHVGRGHLSNLHPIPDFQAKQVVAAAGHDRPELTRADAGPRPPGPAAARLRHDPGRDQPAGPARPTARFVALDAHMEMEDEAVGAPQEDARPRSASSSTSRASSTSPREFERNVKAIDAADHRGVIQGKDHGFEGNLGLVIGAGGGSLTLTDAVRSQGGKPANYAEIGGNPSVAKSKGLAMEVLKKDGVEKIAVMMSIVSNTRVDIVARGVIKACLELGKDPAETIAVFRIPGAWEEEGAKILDKYGIEFRDRTVLDVGGGRAKAVGRRSKARRRMMPILPQRGLHLHRPGHHRARGREPDPRVPRLRLQGRRRRHPRPQGPRGPRRARLRHRRSRRSSTTASPIDGSVVTVPPAFTKDAVFEAIENGIKLIVVVTERIPRRDVAEMVELAERARRADHRPQLPRPDRPRRLQDGRDRRPREGRRQGLQPGPGRRHVAARAG